MNDSIRSSAKVAREFLETIAQGIGRVESGDLARVGSVAADRLSRVGSSASDYTRAGAAALARHIPARFRGGGSSRNVLATLVIAGVVASTAALVYSRVRNRDSRGRRRRH